MTHDAYCLMAKPNPYGSVYCICAILYTARKDEREQAAKRVAEIEMTTFTLYVDQILEAIKNEKP